MTYHISIDTTNTNNETLTKIIHELTSYYNTKYKTLTIPAPPTQNNTQNNITNILQNSIYRQQQKIPDDTIIVFWTTHTYTDIKKYSNKKITSHYINSINKHNPHINIKILLNHTTHQEKEYYNIPYTNNIQEITTMIKQIIKKELPTCKYCGRIIQPTPLLKKYCSTNCRAQERQLQNQESRRRYWKKYKDILPPEQKKSIGTSNLTGTPEPNFTREYQRIQQEKKRLRI